MMVVVLVMVGVRMAVPGRTAWTFLIEFFAHVMGVAHRLFSINEMVLRSPTCLPATSAQGWFAPELAFSWSGAWFALIGPLTRNYRPTPTQDHLRDPLGGY